MNTSLFTAKEIILFLVCLFISSSLLSQSPNESPSISAETKNDKSISQKRKQLKPAELLFAGKTLRNVKKNRVVYLPPVFDALSANTVEGFAAAFKPSFTQHLAEGKFYYLKPGIRYGFGNKSLQAQLTAQYYYAPASKSSIQVSAGRYSWQINELSTYKTNLYNSYTLADQGNYLKIYERTFFSLKQVFSPVKDFLVTASASWNNRKPLQNLSKFSAENSEYAANAPDNNELASTVFEEHQAVLISAQLRWQAKHQYLRHRGAFISDSPHPAVAVTYTQALPNVLSGDLTFSKLALQVSGKLKQGKLGFGRFLLETGDFLNADNSQFTDFKHFNGNRTVIGNFEQGNFQLLDYYSHSTSNFYVQGHYEHRLSGVLMWDEQPILQPVFSINYLYTEISGSYLELGVGVDRILNKWRVDFYGSFQGSTYERAGIRLGFNFD